MVRYMESDFVSRTVEFFPITSFYVYFSKQTFWDPEQERDTPSQNQYLEKLLQFPISSSSQFQMFATLPTSYNEKQCWAHIVASLQACHLDPFEFYIQNLLFFFKKKTWWCGIGNRIHYSVRYRRVFSIAITFFSYINFSEQINSQDAKRLISEFTQG